ncbi:type II secretion system F family protein [Bacillaceae bacterium Marseille-Q3522]|nr:type II secretion system F family protein [Bacillaceae bacterium Marseille-Q3522]
MVVFLITTIAGFLFIVSGYLYLDYRKEKKEWRKDVNDFYNDGEKRKSFIVLIGDKFDQTEMAKPIEEKLKKASLPFTASEYVGALIVGFMGIIIVLQNFFSIGFPINIFVALLLLEGGKRLLFLLRKNKMKQRLIEQLPEICRTLANATRTGMTLTQGINLLAQEIAYPAKNEFKRLANEISLGVEIDTALKEMEKRVANREFQLFVATLLIQKKAGGNLYAVLDEMGQTMDERQIMKQEIKTMTAEQRYVSYIVPVIPIFLVLMMNTVIDGFLDPLFSLIGLVLLGFFLLGIVATFFIVRKITNIRV